MSLQPSGNWIHRHNYNVRICHWINVLCFVYLFLSGLMMFLQFPELYWGDVGFRGYEAIFKLSNWGLTWEEADALGNRQWGRNYHFLFAWIFLFNNIIYTAWNLKNRHFSKRMWPRRNELSKDNLKSELDQHLHLRATKGEAATQYNVFQKLSYLIILFLLFPFMVISGLAQMPAFTAISPELIDLFGGRQSARTLHAISTVLISLFVVIHVFEVFVAGPINHIRAMITGKYFLSAENEEENKEEGKS